MSYTWQSLEGRMATCTDCGLCEHRTNVVFGDGNKSAKIMLIGESPGEEEDQSGYPFMGKAGEKLEKIFSYIGVERKDLYITQSVLCITPNNRNPTADELDKCRWRLMEEISIVKPELIIALGKIATEQLSGSPVKGPLNQFFNGKFMDYCVGNFETQVLITYHPSYHLRNPKRAYEATLPHWTQVKEWLQNK